MRINQLDEFKLANPNLIQLVNGFPGDADSYKIGRTKPADGFKDLLKQIKKNNRGSEIRTFK